MRSRTRSARRSIGTGSSATPTAATSATRAWWMPRSAHGTGSGPISVSGFTPRPARSASTRGAPTGRGARPRRCARPASRTRRSTATRSHGASRTSAPMASPPRSTRSAAARCSRTASSGAWRIISGPAAWSCTRRRRSRTSIPSGRGCIAGSAVRSFDRVIVAGPWIARLVPALAPRVTASRQIVVYVEPPAAEGAAWQAAPLMIEMDRDYAFYAVPPRAGLGLKIGDHRFTLAGDPDRERDVMRGEAEELLAKCRHRFRGGERYRIVEAKTCFYDVEPRERFILEPLDAAGYVMSGFSGHGFKFAALMGELAAAAVLGDRPAAAVRRYAAGESVALA
ncbi:MAG: FAD-dependent oxidoreductase [Alphaproteobacteria bacterium]